MARVSSPSDLKNAGSRQPCRAEDHQPVRGVQVRHSRGGRVRKLLARARHRPRHRVRVSPVRAGGLLVRHHFESGRRVRAERGPHTTTSCAAVRARRGVLRPAIEKRQSAVARNADSRSRAPLYLYAECVKPAAAPQRRRLTQAPPRPWRRGALRPSSPGAASALTSRRVKSAAEPSSQSARNTRGAAAQTTRAADLGHSDADSQNDEGRRARGAPRQHEERDDSFATNIIQPGWARRCAFLRCQNRSPALRQAPIDVDSVRPACRAETSGSPRASATRRRSRTRP